MSTAIPRSTIHNNTTVCRRYLTCQMSSNPFLEINYDISIGGSDHCISSNAGCMERKESVGFPMTALGMGWISNMHLPIKLIECELQAVATMGQYERLVCEDWAIMIFLSFSEEKHRQLILEDPVLEQLLRALSGCLLWTSNEEWTIIGSSELSFCLLQGHGMISIKQYVYLFASTATYIC